MSIASPETEEERRIASAANTSFDAGYEEALSEWVDIYEGEAGLWHATCVLIPNFRVTETSREEALYQIPKVLAVMAQAAKAISLPSPSQG